MIDVYVKFDQDNYKLPDPAGKKLSDLVAESDFLDKTSSSSLPLFFVQSDWNGGQEIIVRGSLLYPAPKNFLVFIQVNKKSKTFNPLLLVQGGLNSIPSLSSENWRKQLEWSIPPYTPNQPCVNQYYWNPFTTIKVKKNKAFALAVLFEKEERDRVNKEIFTKTVKTKLKITPLTAKEYSCQQGNSKEKEVKLKKIDTENINIPPGNQFIRFELRSFAVQEFEN